MLNKKEFSLEKTCQSTSQFANLQEIMQTHSCEAARDFGMSIIHLFIGENDKSLECLELLVNKNPDIPLLHQRIVELCIDSGEFEKAVSHLEKILELEDDDLTAHVWLCLLNFSLGRARKAKENFKYLKQSVYILKVKSKDLD